MPGSTRLALAFGWNKFMETGTSDWLEYLDTLNMVPRRVVSLVPSLTESLFELGWGEHLVGVTDYCRYPENEVAKLPRLGGTKTPRVQEIIDLLPDLVIANREENDQKAVEALLHANIPTWVTFPQNITEALALLYALARLYRSPAASQRIKTLETAVEWTQAASAGTAGFTYFCPIWQGESQDGQRWWMTFNQHTYSHSLLALCGGRNLFGTRVRRYPFSANPASAGEETGEIQPAPTIEDPGGRDTRYPGVSLSEVQSANPDVILLPDEPFPFSRGHKEEIETLLAGTPAVIHGRVYLVDGSLITWFGTRLALSIQSLPAFFTGT